MDHRVRTYEYKVIDVSTGTEALRCRFVCTCGDTAPATGTLQAVWMGFAHLDAVESARVEP